MDTPYTVQSGDTLSKIAQRHGLTVADLQALNPIVKNPDHILPGWQLRLSGFPAQLDLPPPVNANSITSVAIEGQPECHEELVDVAHIPGHSHFYVLTHKQAKALKQEISAVQKLMDELHRNLADALPSAQCKKKQAPDAVCACSACVKETWTVKAEGANLLVREPRATAPAGPPPSSDQDLQGQLATLQSARDWYQAYTPPWKPSSLFESNWKKLQNKKILELDKQINALRVQLAAQRQDKPQGSRPPDSGAIPDLKHGKGRSGAHQLGRQTRTGINVVEVILFSDPSRRHYISTRYHETTQWRTRVSTQVLAGKPLGKSLARELINDIKSAISTTRKVGPLGGLEAKLSSWNNEDDTEFSQWLNPVLNALHQEVAWRSNHSDASRVAVTAEAHALRFAAIASAGVNSWNPREGTIDVGVKGNAAFSLAEASVALHSYFPDQGGYVASMVYRNALDQAVTHPIGVFRLHGKLELSCFAGVRAQAEAGVATGYRPSETSAGATALLGPPTVALTPHGSVGVKADGFAGAQLGGALSGAFQWVAPDDQGKGPAVLGQSNADGNWKDLARINLEGNAAAGVGLAGEFRIEISEDRLAVTCSGSVVFGPGAGGSFATVVDLEQVGRLAWLFCNALAAVDYRYLMGVTGDAFAYLNSGLYKMATSPITLVAEGFKEGRAEMAVWWQKRNATKSEAYHLAKYINNNKSTETMEIRGQHLPFSALPPETLGPMVYLLTEGFVESFNEQQEQALVVLLSEIKTWRQFIKTLEHCSPHGKKVNALKSLERINALLDGYEQNQFNYFIEGLAMHQTSARSTQLAWKTSQPWYKEKTLLAARGSGRFDGLV